MSFLFAYQHLSSFCLNLRTKVKHSNEPVCPDWRDVTAWSWSFTHPKYSDTCNTPGHSTLCQHFEKNAKVLIKRERERLLIHTLAVNVCILPRPTNDFRHFPQGIAFWLKASSCARNQTARQGAGCSSGLLWRHAVMFQGTQQFLLASGSIYAIYPFRAER